MIRRIWDFTSDRIIYPLLLGLGWIAIMLCLSWEIWVVGIILINLWRCLFG